MKYLTFDWWCNGQDPARQVEIIDQYTNHVQAIRHRLTPDLLRLEDGNPSLHDSNLVELTVDLPKRIVHISLDGCNEDDHPPFRIELIYRDVTSFVSKTNGLDHLSGPGGYGDLGYLETHLVGDRFEHCMIFRTGIEFSIEFGDFSLIVSDVVPGQEQPDEEQG